MKVTMGVDSGKTGKHLKSSLKKGDVLYAAAYNAATESVEFDKFEFDEYIKQFTQTEKMAKFYKLSEDGKRLQEEKTAEDGSKTMNDIIVILDAARGLFLDKKSALDALAKAVSRINSIVQKAKKAMNSKQ